MPNCSISNSDQACLREVVLRQMASPTATVTAGTLATVSVAQIGLLVIYTHVFGSPEPTTSPAPGTVTVPTCPECPPLGYGALTLLATAAVALLCGAGVAALTPLVTAFVPSGLVGFLASTGVCAATSGRSSTRVIKPYQQEPGESDSE